MTVILIILMFIYIAVVSAADEQQLNDNLTASNENDIVLDISINEINGNESNLSSGGNTLLGASNSDDSVLGATDDGTLDDLRTRINNAGWGDTVLLENDYNFGSSSSGAGISISKDLIIDGQGHTIDANEMGRIFNIPSISGLTLESYNVTLKNIIFRNANYASAGHQMVKLW